MAVQQGSFRSEGVSAALNYETAASSIDRFNKPLNKPEVTTFGFQGFPENYMQHPKRPLRHQPSADVSTEVNRYFRKDSATEWRPEPNKARMASPPPREQVQKEPEWLAKRSSPPPPAPQPVEQLHQTISPRYADESQSYRKAPVIRDPLRELTSAERRKKIDEHYQAEEDLAMARQRREKEKYEKLEEQQRMRYGDENRGMDRVRSSMEQRNEMPERREEMLEDQAAQLRRMQDEIDRLKAQDDLSYRPGGRPSFDPNPRAQSDLVHKHWVMFTGTPEAFFMMECVGGYSGNEPQTERTMRRYNRDSEIFGQSVQRVPDYLNVSPRRHPVGKLYNKESTYKTDYDPPFVRHGRRGLGDPNKEPYEPFNPYGLEGGGAPMVDASGQRRTRIAGSMDILGREDSHSAQARRAHKRTLLNTIGEQAAYDRRKREEEKAWEKTPYVEVAKTMREKKVGYPKYDRFGIISEHHHLPHMFNTNANQELTKQRQYHDYLASQVEEKNRNTRLGQLEEKRQAREHFRTQDAFFGRRGGGNIKGENLRKVNLEKAIYDPQSAINYEGRAPYAEYGQM